MPSENSISWRQSQALAAGNPPPPGGPDGPYRFMHAAPPENGSGWTARRQSLLIGYTYIVRGWPTMDDINESMDHGYLLSESQLQVSFEIEELGEVFFGMMDKKRLGPSDGDWEMHGCTAELCNKTHIAIFFFDFHQGVGTVVFAE